MARERDFMEWLNGPLRTHEPVDDDDTSTSSSSSEESSSSIDPPVANPRQQQQWLERSVIARYTQESFQQHHLISEADLWDELAVEYPKANERRQVIQKILEARRDRIEEQERQQRIQEMEAAEQIREAEEVLRKAASRAALSGEFSKPKRKLKLTDE